MPSYPGGKAGSGVYQKLINQMPPHSRYIEPFLGGGAVMRLKLSADVNIGIDLSNDAIRAARSHIARVKLPLPAAHAQIADGRRRSAESGGSAGMRSPEFRFYCQDALKYLSATNLETTDLVYCDPPYLLETRSSGPVYQHEMTREQHSKLLDVLRRLPCLVMISGYWSDLYGEALKDWRTFQFEAMTRGGYTKTETVWCNYASPVALHDYRYLGEGYRQRQDLKRQKQRWLDRLHRMPILQRQMLEAAIAETGISNDVRLQSLF